MGHLLLALQFMYTITLSRFDSSIQLLLHRLAVQFSSSEIKCCWSSHRFLNLLWVLASGALLRTPIEKEGSQHQKDGANVQPHTQVNLATEAQAI